MSFESGGWGSASGDASWRVETTAGSFEGDYLVIALGADYDVARTPGLAEVGHEVDFFGDRPRGTLQGPSLALAADKQEFGHPASGAGSPASGCRSALSSGAARMPRARQGGVGPRA